MNRIMPACVIAAVTLVTQFPILAQPVERDGISSGRQIAAKICGNCHEISPTMSPKTEVGPRFDDIANLPSTTALSLKVFLRSSHKRMRNLILSGADSDDVIAYISASSGGSLTSPNPLRRFRLFRACGRDVPRLRPAGPHACQGGAAVVRRPAFRS